MGVKRGKDAIRIVHILSNWGSSRVAWGPEPKGHGPGLEVGMWGPICTDRRQNIRAGRSSVENLWIAAGSFRYI